MKISPLKHSGLSGILNKMGQFHVGYIILKISRDINTIEVIETVRAFINIGYDALHVLIVVTLKSLSFLGNIYS